MEGAWPETSGHFGQIVCQGLGLRMAMNGRNIHLKCSRLIEGSSGGLLSTNLADAHHEAARLQELYQYQVLDTDPDPELDELTQLAAELCQTPIAFISLLDADRQWFKAKIGLSVSEAPRHPSAYTHAIQPTELVVIPDVLLDQQLFPYPVVLDNAQLRFYAGASLITPSGFVLGTLCVADYQPRQLSQQQLKQLRILSRQVMMHLEARRQSTEAAQLHTRFLTVQQQLVEKEKLSQQEFILFNLANQIRNSLDLDTILQTAVDEIRQLLQVNYCHFLWCLPDGDGFKLLITHEAKQPDIAGLNHHFGKYDSDIAETIRNLQILQIDDVYRTTLPAGMQELLIRQGIRSKLLIPLQTYSGQLGAIVCSHSTSVHYWTMGEVQILQAITDQLAIAVNQAELFAETRATALAAETQAQYLAEALQKLQQTQAQLIQHEKMSSLGQLVAGVAHEINNPVNFINGNITYAADYIANILQILQLYQEHYPEPISAIQELAESIDLDFITQDLPRLLSSMKIGVERIYQIVVSLRNFSRLDEAEIKAVNLHEGIDNTLLILHSRLKQNQMGQPIRVFKEYENLPLIECCAGQLNQVFMNLLSNAIDALDDVSDHPSITISTELAVCSVANHLECNVDESVESTSQVIIRIRDNGCGMTEAVQQKIFNPFFTTKPVGKGTGLGLSISYQIIVDKHGGTLDCLSKPGSGTEFRIQIPVQAHQIKS